MTWTHIDESEYPQTFVKFLKEMSALDATKVYKEKIVTLAGLMAGQSVLEVGCGTGDDLIDLSCIVGVRGRVVGVDKSAVMVSCAKQKCADAANVEVMVAAAEDLPFADCEFDLVRVDRVLQHLLDPVVALQEMARVLKGKDNQYNRQIVACEPDWSSLTLDGADKQLTEIINQVICSTINHPTAGRRLQRWFSEAGLVLEQLIADQFVFDNFRSADNILKLTPALDYACAQGLITCAKAKDWLENLADLDRSGKFLASITGYGAFGKK